MDNSNSLIIEITPKKWIVEQSPIVQKIIEDFEIDIVKFHRTVFSKMALMIISEIKDISTFSYYDSDNEAEKLKPKIKRLKKIESTLLKTFGDFLFIAQEDKEYHKRCIGLIDKVLSKDLSFEVFIEHIDKLKIEMGHSNGVKLFFDVQSQSTSANLGQNIIELYEKISLEKERANSSSLWGSHNMVLAMYSTKCALDFATQNSFFFQPYRVNPKLIKCSSEQALELFNIDIGRQLKETKTEKNKLNSMINLIIGTCLKILKFNHENIAKREITTNNKFDMLEGIVKEEISLGQNQYNLVSAMYEKFKDNIEQVPNMHYKEKMLTIINAILDITLKPEIFSILSSDIKYDITNIYPELLKSFKKQCVLDFENYELMKQKDELLEVALDKFIEKTSILNSGILKQKFTKDTHETKVLHQYLKQKS